MVPAGAHRKATEAAAPAGPDRREEWWALRPLPTRTGWAQPCRPLPEAAAGPGSRVHPAATAGSRTRSILSARGGAACGVTLPPLRNAATAKTTMDLGHKRRWHGG